MTIFKFVLNNKEKSYKIEKEVDAIIGKKIGDKIDGEILGLSGYELEITGGTDKDGFPLLKNIEGIVKKKKILKKGSGFKTSVAGLRKRKTVRGNTISQTTRQINCKITKEDAQKLEDIFGIGKKQKEAEEKPEHKDKEKKEKPKEETKSSSNVKSEGSDKKAEEKTKNEKIKEESQGDNLRK